MDLSAWDKLKNDDRIRFRFEDDVMERNCPYEFDLIGYYCDASRCCSANSMSISRSAGLHPDCITCWTMVASAENQPEKQPAELFRFTSGISKEDK